MWIRLITLALLGGALASCGRVSRPIPPEGSTYPYPYAVTQNAD